MIQLLLLSLLLVDDYDVDVDGYDNCCCCLCCLLLTMMLTLMVMMIVVDDPIAVAVSAAC